MTTKASILAAFPPLPTIPGSLKSQDGVRQIYRQLHARDEAIAEAVAKLLAGETKQEPAAYVTAIEEGKVLLLDRPSLNKGGLVPVYAAPPTAALEALLVEAMEWAVFGGKIDQTFAAKARELARALGGDGKGKQA